MTAARLRIVAMDGHAPVAVQHRRAVVGEDLNGLCREVRYCGLAVALERRLDVLDVPGARRRGELGGAGGGLAGEDDELHGCFGLNFKCTMALLSRTRLVFFSNTLVWRRLTLISLVGPDGNSDSKLIIFRRGNLVRRRAGARYLRRTQIT